MNFKHITNSLKDIVSEHLFPVTKVETVETAKPTLPDETLKLIFVNEQQRKKVFVLCSSAVSPKLVERGHLRSKEIKAALGEKLGRAILTPILAGNTAGLSYCLFPYCQTLHTNKIAYWLQRKLLTAGILDWLNQAAAITASDVTSSSDLQDDFITPLSHLSNYRNYQARFHFQPITRWTCSSQKNGSLDTLSPMVTYGWEMCYWIKADTLIQKRFSTT